MVFLFLCETNLCLNYSTKTNTKRLMICDIKAEVHVWCGWRVTASSAVQNEWQARILLMSSLQRMDLLELVWLNSHATSIDPTCFCSRLYHRLTTFLPFSFSFASTPLLPRQQIHYFIDVTIVTPRAITSEYNT